MMPCPRTPLGRDLVVALAFKAAALVLLYAAFFGPWQRPEVTLAGIERALIGTSSGTSTADSPAGYAR